MENAGPDWLRTAQGQPGATGGGQHTEPLISRLRTARVALSLRSGPDSLSLPGKIVIASSGAGPSLTPTLTCALVAAQSHGGRRTDEPPRTPLAA